MGLADPTCCLNVGECEERRRGCDAPYSYCYSVTAHNSFTEFGIPEKIISSSDGIIPPASTRATRERELHVPHELGASRNMIMSIEEKSRSTQSDFPRIVPAMCSLREQPRRVIIVWIPAFIQIELVKSVQYQSTNE